jgi:glucosamine--fructose-6-phosphate aminotransferase (isomerizing)
MRVKESNDTLVIGISASGKTQRVVQGLEKANKYGGLTLALTGTPDSPVTTVAQRSICVEVPNMGPSPGIRTYNASLMGLGLLALQIGEVKENLDQTEIGELHKQLSDLANALEQTANAAEKTAQDAANALSDAQMMMFLGSGPSYGTALFSAAKIVEAAGVFAIGQDLEEWAHVERFAYPIDMPVFIIAPPGKSHWRAAKLAKAAQYYGRRVVAIIKDGDNEITQNSDFTFPIFGEMREEFSPLIYHTTVNFFATYLTANLDRKPFQGDKPKIRQKYEEINAFQLDD